MKDEQDADAPDAKREAVEGALDSEQPQAAADGAEVSPAVDLQPADGDAAAPMATEEADGAGSARSARGSAGAAPVKPGPAEPRITKAQAAAQAEAEAAAAIKKGEMQLASLYMSETSSNVADEKVLKQAKTVKKRSDQDSLVRRMTRYSEPPRKKSHWDYLLQEMEWMSNDFRQERKWKMALAKKTAQAVMKWHKQKEGQSARDKKVEQQNLKKIASKMSRDVKQFWGQVGKLVVYKHEMQIEEVRQQNMEKHMDFMVGQTERYSQLLADEINKPGRPKGAKDDPKADPDFQPSDAADDEATLMEEEGAGSNAAEKEAVDAMGKEGAAPIADVLEKAGVGKEAAAAGEIPDPSAGGSAAMDVDGEEVSPEDAAARASEDKDLAMLLEANSIDLTDEEKKLQKKNTARMTSSSSEADSAQPKGWTLSTAGQGNEPIETPFLIKASLREYQSVALKWMIALYDKRLNGILADEMGLGKTLMTISMLAYLAVERGHWGPHLIVVPTSVMLNWEIEFKKWAPAFKVVTYYGSQKERKEKRVGWSKQNAFHVCITSYQLVVQDHHVFRRKKWGYLILDEAHHIKNFQSQRWQTMLNFNAKRRLLITGTPLQNNLMELWSLMHFLMPQIFASHKEFKDWFSNPLNNIAGGQEVTQSNSLIGRLHGILRPFILRRLKSQVEKQLPGKTEHMVPCPLSPRQRVLYEEYMQRSDTKQCLAGGNYIGIMNVVMQLRKVCNHPDLFEVRPIVSPFDVPAPRLSTGTLAATVLDYDPFVHTATATASSLVQVLAFEHMSMWDAGRGDALKVTQADMIKAAGLEGEPDEPPADLPLLAKLRFGRRQRYRESRLHNIGVQAGLNENRCKDAPVWGRDLITAVTLAPYSTKRMPGGAGTGADELVQRWWRCEDASLPPHADAYETTILSTMCKSWDARYEEQLPSVKRLVCTIMKARSTSPEFECGNHTITLQKRVERATKAYRAEALPILDRARAYDSRKQLYFPDKRLVQFDCGKLQRLDMLLRELKNGGHRCLLFTQMSKMLDVMEHFLNLYGYTYLRLDGSTKPEDRQKMMDRFNGDPRFFVFILSTRAGGVGINLTGADTVIFYDSDWNPAMDAQAQDRCHRIGQTKEVHIYRLISEHTVEENILAKSRQKAHLNDMVLQDGNFNTEAFSSWGSNEVKTLFDKPAEPEPKSSADEDNDESEESKKEKKEAAAKAVAAKAAKEAEAAKGINVLEVQSAMAEVEGEDDAAAAKRAERESAAEADDFKDEKDEKTEKVSMEKKVRGDFLAALKAGRTSGNRLGGEGDKVRQHVVEFDWETDLLPVQKYGMDFLVKVYPMVDMKQSVEKLDYQEQAWELDKLNQLREEEAAKIDEDEEMLFYDVADDGDSREAELHELRQAYLDAQKLAEDEIARQNQVLEVGPPTTVMLEPEVDERRDQIVAPIPGPGQPVLGAQRQPNRRPHGQRHDVHGDGDGMFNLGNRSREPKRRPRASDKNRAGGGYDDLYTGPPWSDKQDFQLVFAVSRFGENWMLVSEVVSKSPALGPFRSRENCAARYRNLAQERHSGLMAQQEEFARQSREDARSVCHDNAAVKRFHELSRCVQKRVSDLGKQLSSGSNNAPTAASHTSHLVTLKSHLPEGNMKLRDPDEIPDPATSSRDRHDRAHPLKPVLSRPDSRRGAGRGGGMQRPGANGRGAGYGASPAAAGVKRKAPGSAGTGKRQAGPMQVAPGQQPQGTPLQIAQQAMQANVYYTQQSGVSTRATEMARQHHAAAQAAQAAHQGVEASGPSAEALAASTARLQAVMTQYNAAQKDMEHQAQLLQQAQTQIHLYNQSMQANPQIHQHFQQLHAQHEQQRLANDPAAQAAAAAAQAAATAAQQQAEQAAQQQAAAAAAQQQQAAAAAAASAAAAQPQAAMTAEQQAAAQAAAAAAQAAAAQTAAQAQADAQAQAAAQQQAAQQQAEAAAQATAAAQAQAAAQVQADAAAAQAATDAKAAADAQAAQAAAEAAAAGEAKVQQAAAAAAQAAAAAAAAAQAAAEQEAVAAAEREKQQAEATAAVRQHPSPPLSRASQS